MVPREGGSEESNVKADMMGQNCEARQDRQNPLSLYRPHFPVFVDRREAGAGHPVPKGQNGRWHPPAETDRTNMTCGPDACSSSMGREHQGLHTTTPDAQLLVARLVSVQRLRYDK